jgi:hypothetical protein
MRPYFNYNQETFVKEGEDIRSVLHRDGFKGKFMDIPAMLTPSKYSISSFCRWTSMVVCEENNSDKAALSICSNSLKE